MTRTDWIDQDGIKIYTISVLNLAVDQSQFLERLNILKKSREISWQNTPAFVIFHEGSRYLYLILAWWQNDNELFTSVSVLKDHQWIEDSQKYSFCLYDLEIFWAERNIFIETMDCQTPNLNDYRNRRLEIQDQ